MSTTTFTPATTAPEATASTGAQGTRVTWKRGLAVGVVATAVVTAIAGVFQAAGHALSVVDGPVPLAAFPQMVLLSTIVGIVIARHTSRTTFYRVTVVLTVLSSVPDVAWGDGFVSKAGLILTHVVAAVIIVPRLARR